MGVGIPNGVEAGTCEDFDERIARCKHIGGVVYWLEAAKADPIVQDPFPPVPRKRFRPINSGVYNKAQTEEYRLVHVLLRELAASIPEPSPSPRVVGRGCLFGIRRSPPSRSATPGWGTVARRDGGQRPSPGANSPGHPTGALGLASLAVRR